MRQGAAFRILRPGEVAGAELRAPQLKEVVGVVGLQLDATRPEPFGDRGRGGVARLTLQFGDFARTHAVHDAGRCIALLRERGGAPVRGQRIEERRVRSSQRLDVERSAGVCVAKRRRPARLPEEADRGPGRGVRPRPRFRVEAPGSEQPPQVGQELQVA